MFCTYCGFQNSEGTNFCGNCGKPLVPIQTKTQNTVNLNPSVQSQSDVLKNSNMANINQIPKVGPKWASIGAILVLFCFFMPWLMVSCGGITVKASGWQLSTGNFGSGYQNQVQAYPAIFLILLVGLIGFVCLNGKRSGAIAAIVSGLAGVIGMIVFSANLSSQSTYYVQVSYEVGYYGEWLGFLIMIGVGIFAFRQMSPQSSIVTTPIHQNEEKNVPIVSIPSSPPPVVNSVPSVDQTGLGTNNLNPNPNASGTQPDDSTPKKNTWKEIG